MILPKDFFWLLHTKSERLKDLNTFAGPNAEATFLNFPHRFRHIHRRRYRKDTNTGRWAVGVRRCCAALRPIVCNGFCVKIFMPCMARKRVQKKEPCGLEWSE